MDSSTVCVVRFEFTSASGFYAEIKRLRAEGNVVLSARLDSGVVTVQLCVARSQVDVTEE